MARYDRLDGHLELFYASPWATKACESKLVYVNIQVDWSVIIAHVMLELVEVYFYLYFMNTAWCSEIGSPTSLDAPELHASNDVREPISLHQTVY